MILRTLSKQEVAETPYSVWNAFVDLLAMENYADLSPVQRPAHLVFWYYSEVENGGHLQYFENQGTERLAETVESLSLLGATGHQQILREAGERWLSRPRPRIETAQEFCDTALQGEFKAWDDRFYAFGQELSEYLEEYLMRYQVEFVVVS